MTMEKCKLENGKFLSRCGWARRRLRVKSAIRADGLADDEAGFIAGQKQRNGGDFFRFADSAKRRVGGHQRTKIVRQIFQNWGFHPSGSNAVHANALRGVLLCHAFGEGQNTAFGCGV